MAARLVKVRFSKKEFRVFEKKAQLLNVESDRPQMKLDPVKSGI